MAEINRPDPIGVTNVQVIECKGADPYKPLAAPEPVTLTTIKDVRNISELRVGCRFIENQAGALHCGVNFDGKRLCIHKYPR